MALESFAIEFQKLVDIQEQAQINNQIDATVFIAGNSAMADVKAESTALGPNSFTDTLGATSTSVVQGVGSSSSSIAESTAAAQPNDLAFHL